MFSRDEPLTTAWRDNREVLVYVFPLRLPSGSREGIAGSAPITAPGTGPVSPGRRGPVLAEVGIFRDSISAQFGGLQQASIVNVLAACALMTSLVAMALRFPAYVRGRQTDAQLFLARRVQQDLLPASMPPLAHADVGAVCAPAFDVGGDLFDLISIDEDRFVFLFGDVSGKGISAAILMAVVHGAFHGGELKAAGGDVARWMKHLNEMLVQRSAGNRFVTLFCGAFDARTATVTYVNGGHPSPLLFRAGDGPPRGPERLETGGPVVGLLPDASFQEGRAVVRRGDVILIYSDGVTEATNRTNSEFGVERLSTIVAHERDGGLRNACDRVLEAVRTFAGRAEPEDDQTVMVLRFGEPRSQPRVTHDGAEMTTREPTRTLTA
jgi:serine phosphatase RsbU (regulator of sigma subunit)